MANIKDGHKQKNKPKNRQGKNNMPPYIDLGANKEHLGFYIAHLFNVFLIYQHSLNIVCRFPPSDTICEAILKLSLCS